MAICNNCICGKATDPSKVCTRFPPKAPKVPEPTPEVTPEPTPAIKAPTPKKARTRRRASPKPGGSAT